MVSISWYLSENVRVEMSKTQHFEKFEKVICSELAAKVYIYVCIYTDMGTGRKRRENEDHSWTMESPPTRYRAGRGSTAGMATDMIGPRWKRRSFVDDGIPPDRVPFRSRFHRWNGFRHDRATMETKIIRGRWNPPPDMAPEAACLPCPAVAPAPNRQPQPCNMLYEFGLRAGARVLTT